MALRAVAEERVRLHVSTPDAITRVGISSQLRSQARLELVGEDQLGPGVVGLVVADEVDDETARSIRTLKRDGVDRVVLVVTRVDDAGLLAAVEAGATCLVRRSQATPQRLLEAIESAAAGQGALPPDLLARLLDQVSRLQRQVLHPRGLTMAGLTEREVKVLKLLAEGLDTAEVGRTLFYSDRTVKNIVHDVTSRLELRNRTHAVAYAIKQGLI